MPVRTRSIYDKRAGDERYSRLKERLIAEWSGGSGDSPAPEIEEEQDARGRIARVVVIWDAWSDLDAQTRSELIVDAFRAVKGDPAIVDLTLAMGLTSGERTRLSR